MRYFYSVTNTRDSVRQHLLRQSWLRYRFRALTSRFVSTPPCWKHTPWSPCCKWLERVVECTASVECLSTRTVYQYKIQLLFFLIVLGGYGHTGKWIQEHIIFMRFCCCFKLSKNIEKLSYEQLTHAIANCSLTGLVQQAKKSRWKWDLKLRMCISHDIASSFHCRIHWLEFKMPLPPAKNPKDPCLHKGNRGSQTLN